jgi:two-component system sensor histidine kinase VanS
MRIRFFGIFGKVFFYTCLILIFVVSVFFVLFSSQIKNTVNLTQQRQLGEAFLPLLQSIRNETDDEIVKMAKRFHSENRSLNFCIENADGVVLYQTKNFVGQDSTKSLRPGSILSNENLPAERLFKFSVARGGNSHSLFLVLTVGDKKFYVSGPMFTASVLEEIRGEVLLAFALIFLVSLIAAAVFAQRIAKPIRTLAHNSRKMAGLEEAPSFPPRRDEIGQLAKDVYSMHQNLKNTIGRLEEEIERERTMEENQRYFFSAASHELKTPIAAASAILEGMAENVIEPEEYPRYLREALRLMKEQNTLVTEILDIVKMNDRMITPVLEDVELSHLINTALETFQPLFEAKEQILLLDAQVDTICRTDPRLLTKALTNILQNATQNSPRGAKIHIAVKAEQKSCTLSVENSGAHISDEKLPKLFEPFFVEDEARSKQRGRNGLGLTIVKKILDLLEIPFDLQNTENGVRFSMTLPCP